MPNIVAYTMLLSWPLAAGYLFQRLSLERAVIWGIIVPFMVLPSATGIDLPAVPPLNKTTLPNLVLLILAIAYCSGPFRLLLKSAPANLCLFLIIFGPFATAITNPDPLIFPAGYIPGLTLHDALSNTIRSALIVIPFIVGYQCLGSANAHRTLLKALVLAALLYSVPMLIEIRLSPQLHNWIYGFYQHSFLQQMRGEGFRPMVMMSHGLIVALFTMFALASAAALWSIDRKNLELGNNKWMIKLLFLMVMLILCKSLASMMYGFFAVILFVCCSLRLQMRVAAILALLTILYPVMRGADLVPVASMMELAEAYHPQRAESLGVRFDNEKVLLERAEERMLFGWGSWGRNHIHDPTTGAETSITDGLWIIMIGSTGWLGFLSTFGILALPILLLLRRQLREGTTTVPPETVALCLILAINMVDLLPNAALLPLTWLIAGSLLGYAKQKSIITDDTLAIAEASETAQPRTIL